MDREKVIKGLEIVSKMLNEMGRLLEMDIVDDSIALLKEQPQIVRCKDCKWHDNADDSPKYLPCMEMRTNPNWFCADGEREGR